MALVLADRVRDTTTTTGTGTVTLSGTAPTGYQNFSVIGNGNTTYYTINAGSQWEVGIGTYSSTGPTLARTTVLESSNANALVNFSAGTKDVFVTYPSDKAVYYDGSNNVGIGTSSPSVKLDVNGSASFGATITTGTGVSTGDAHLELGGNRTGSGNAYIDLHAVTGTDFEARIIRYGGTNSSLEINNTGTGGMLLNNSGAAPMVFYTTAAERMRIDSSGNVGIGTTSPVSKLSVSGSFDCSGVGKIGTTVAQSSPSATDIISTSNSILGGQGGNAIYVGQYPTTFASWIQSSFTNPTTATYNIVLQPLGGNVGIGTSAPDRKLDVQGSGSITVRSRSTDTTGVTVGILAAEHASGSSLQVRAGVGFTNLISTGAADPLILSTNSTERMRVDTSGNVGIGTSSPTTIFHVQQNNSANIGMRMRQLSTTQFAGAGLLCNGPVSSSTQGGTAFYHYNRNTGGTNGALAMAQFDENGSFQRSLAEYYYNEQAWLFYTNGSERLRIDSSGNLLVGSTAAPSGSGTNLQVSNAGSARMWLTSTGNRNFYLESGSAAALQFVDGTAAAERMRITSAGNVGIGTTAPLARLFAEVPSSVGAAFAYAANSNGAYPTGVFGGSFGYNFSAGGAEVDFWNGWTGATGTQGGFAFRRQTGASSQNLLMTIRGDGNVGIGTSSPLYQTTVLGLGQETAALTDAGNKGGSLYLQATGVTSGSGGAVLFGTTFGNQTPFAAIKGLVTDGTANTIGDLAFSTRNATSDTALTERMRILRAGNVGIGTSSPAYLLHLNQNGNTQAWISATNVGSNSAGIGFENQGQRNWQIWADRTNDALQFGNNSRATTNMVINSSGNVGIGLTSLVSGYAGGGPALNIKNGGSVVWPNASGTWNTTTAGAAITYFTDNNLYIDAKDSASNMIFRVNGDTERVRITSAGNVGIGTSSPGAKLDVTGNIRLSAAGPNIEFNAGGGMVYGPAANTLAFATGGGPASPVERARINSSGEFLTGTTVGGRAVCMFASDMWLRLSNASRQWLIGPSIGTSFNIWDETGGYNAFNIDTSANINGRNSIFLGSGQNLDNKIEVGAGRTGNNFAYIDLIGDTTYTDYGLRLLRSNTGPNAISQLTHRGTGDMYISTEQAAPIYFQTSGATRMFIEAGGTVQMNGVLLVGRNSASTDVNTANDTGSFSVRGSTTTVAVMSFHRAGAYAINMGLGTDNVFRIGGWSASSNAFQMDGSGNLTMLGNVTAYSDARMKKDVETIDSALDLVSKMRGVRYTRTDTQQRGVGVIAQEMLEVCPEVVQQGIGNDDTLSVAYGNLVGVLIEAVKELTARVAELEGK